MSFRVKVMQITEEVMELKAGMCFKDEDNMPVLLVNLGWDTWILVSLVTGTRETQDMDTFQMEMTLQHHYIYLGHVSQFGTFVSNSR